jgi:hypothetical protein
MGRYDAHKNPFSYRMIEWAMRKTTNATEQLAKSVPMHVQKVEKDFVHASFQTNNGIFTMPVMKMPQSFSGYGREPTQQKDMGNAVPSNYYMGGVSGFAGGNTSFFPRGNLSSLSYQPSSNLKASGRDYDQHTETGGPSGWITKVMDQSGMQGGDQGGGDGAGAGGGTIGAASVTAARANLRVMQQRNFIQASRMKIVVSPMDSSSSGSTGSSGSSGGGGSSGDQQQKSKTQFSFDKDDLATIQSKDTDHTMTVDSKNKKMTLKVPKNENIYVGGDGKEGEYAQLVTTKGPVINAKGRIK